MNGARAIRKRRLSAFPTDGDIRRNCYHSDIMNVVAPGITVQDYNEGKGKPIDLFEGRVKHWILAYAKHLAYEHEQKEHAGIAVLNLASSIFEPLGGVLPMAKRRRNSEVNFC